LQQSGERVKQDEERQMPSKPEEKLEKMKDPGKKTYNTVTRGDN